MNLTVFRSLLVVQSVYTLITAIWPLVDIRSFVVVTGPKTDIWLVKTVGALLIPVAVSLASHLFIKTDHRPAFLLGALSALAFASIDFYYVFSNVISAIYLADGVLQLIFLIVWIGLFARVLYTGKASNKQQ